MPRLLEKTATSPLSTTTPLAPVNIAQVVVYKDLLGAKNLTASQMVPTSQLANSSANSTSPVPLFTCGATNLPGGVSCKKPSVAAFLAVNLGVLTLNEQRVFASGHASLVQIIKPSAYQVSGGCNE
jgi:hypothetical protein